MTTHERYTVAESEICFRLKDKSWSSEEIDALTGRKQGSAKGLFRRRSEPYEFETVKHLCETLCERPVPLETLAALVREQSEKALPMFRIREEVRRSKRLELAGDMVSRIKPLDP